MYKINSRKNGSTLADLLVVLLVIGLLAVTIATVLTYIRKQASDSIRVSEVRQIERMLELYYDKNAFYPSSLSYLVSEGFMKAIPIPPSGTGQRLFQYVPLGTTLICTGYHLGITLETNYQKVLDKDSDSYPSIVCKSFNGADFDGTANNCTSEVLGEGESRDKCYDIIVNP